MMAPVLLLAALGLIVWRGVVAGPAEVGPVGWARGTRWAVVRPLARADTRRLLRHPAFVVGVVLTPLMLMASISEESSWWRISPATALALVPLGWATIIATNLLAIQPRRTGADELFAAAPAPQPVRSAGLMLSAAPAAAVAAVLAAGWLVILSGDGDLTGSPRPLEIAAGLLIVAGSVTVGVGVARWLPGVGFGILAAVATSVIQARLFELDKWPWHRRSEADPLRFLAFLADPTSVGQPALEFRPAGWHLVYLAALVLVMAGIALARDGVPRLLGGLLGAALVLTMIAGWAQVRPPTDRQVAQMVALLTDPVSAQTCVSNGPVRYCASGENLGRVDDWRRRVAAVHALVPATVAARALVVADRAPTVSGNNNCAPQPFFEGLHPDVAAKVTAEQVWPDDGGVHPGTDRFPCGGRGTKELFTAVQVGSWAVGLPPSPHHLDVRCTATGEARSVVALWLGAAATPEGGRTLRELVDDRSSSPGGRMVFLGWDDPPMWGVTFATADAELALRLLAIPKARVAAALGPVWETVTAPGTTSTELARRTGLDIPATATATGGSACP